MSRSGYQDDLDQKDLAMWRGRVASATRGRRGQALLIDLRDALDAMPVKRLIKHEFVAASGEVCALGACGQKRGVKDLDKLDPEYREAVAATFDVAIPLSCEIQYMNDEYYDTATPERRWEMMRAWAVSQIIQRPLIKGA